MIEKWKNNAATPTAMAAEIQTIQVTDTQTAVAQAFTPVVNPGDVVDAKGVVMVLVPGGKFTMGSDSGLDDERPPHDIYLDAYFIDEYEVTNALYKDCVSAY